MNKFCMRCGSDDIDQNGVCQKCGQVVNEPAAPQAGCVPPQPNQAPQYGQPQYGQPQYGQPQYTQYNGYNQYPAQAGQKSRMAAGLLGIFLGAFGIHNFYLGFTSKAVAQLLISVLSLGLLSWASGIWGLIEGIMILTRRYNVDANGVPLDE